MIYDDLTIYYASRDPAGPRSGTSNQVPNRKDATLLILEVRTPIASLSGKNVISIAMLNNRRVTHGEPALERKKNGGRCPCWVPHPTVSKLSGQVLDPKRPSTPRDERAERVRFSRLSHRWCWRMLKLQCWENQIYIYNIILLYIHGCVFIYVWTCERACLLIFLCLWSQLNIIRCTE